MGDQTHQENGTKMVHVKLGAKWVDMLACMQAVTGEGIGSLIEYAIRESGTSFYRWLRGAIQGDEVPPDLDLAPVLAVFSPAVRAELQRLRVKVAQKGQPSYSQRLRQKVGRKGVPGAVREG